MRPRTATRRAGSCGGRTPGGGSSSAGPPSSKKAAGSETRPLNVSRRLQAAAAPLDAAEMLVDSVARYRAPQGCQPCLSGGLSSSMKTLLSGNTEPRQRYQGAAAKATSTRRGPAGSEPPLVADPDRDRPVGDSSTGHDPAVVVPAGVARRDEEDRVVAA